MARKCRPEFDERSLLLSLRGSPHPFEEFLEVGGVLGAVRAEQSEEFFERFEDAWFFARRIQQPPPGCLDFSESSLPTRNLKQECHP